jgi:phytoene synthase
MSPRSPDSAGWRADLAACRALLRTGSRTFHAASYLLPRAVRDPSIALYAFCRLADDAIDESGGGSAALDGVRERVDRVYAGRPLPEPADRAFADIVARHAIPRALPDALVEGFAWDLDGRRYRELADLEAYAARVAGTVGAMMAMLMGVRSADAVARACDLGVAMQLSNIARDVGEDARRGRVYLPLAWMDAAGIDVERWLARPAHDDALATVVERLLAHADRLYGRIESGIGALPPACRPGIRAAALLYADIGQAVRRRGLDAVSARAFVPGRRKLALVARAVTTGDARAPAAPVPPLEATRPMVAAVVAAPSPQAQDARIVAPWKPEARLLRFLDLVERLERRDRTGLPA